LVKNERLTVPEVGAGWPRLPGRHHGGMWSTVCWDMSTAGTGPVCLLSEESLARKVMQVEYGNSQLFRLTWYKSFIPLEVKDSSLRLYVCHHIREGRRKKGRRLPLLKRIWRREAAWSSSLVVVLHMVGEVSM
jgi:hypothetical protein